MYREGEKVRTRGDVEKVCLANIPASIPCASDLVYGGSQVKVTRISRCPGSICSRGGDVVEIKSSFDRRGREMGKRGRVALDEDESRILLRENILKKKLFPPQKNTRVHYYSEFIRTMAITHFSFRVADVHRRYGIPLSSSHSGALVYGVTSILRFGIFHGLYISAERYPVAARVMVMLSFR